MNLRNLTWIKLAAPNSPSDNPQRLYIGLDSLGNAQVVADEGYGGGPDVARKTFRIQINIPKAEYHRWYQWSEKVGRLIHS